MTLKVEFTPEEARKLEGNMKFILEAAGQKALEAAIERAPARGEGPYATGQLRQSLRGQMIDDKTFEISCPASYGVFLEFGTGPKGAESGAWPEFQNDPQPSLSYHNGEVLVTRAGGHLLDVPYVRHTQGMYAAPFMRPALLTGYDWLKRLLDELG